MKAKYFLVATISMVTFLSSVRATCVDCTKYADGALLRDPTSCSHYYRCVQGRSEHKDCGTGFYFDERFLICNFAAFVDCNIPGNLADKTTAPPKPTCSTPTTTCAPIIITPKPTPAEEPEPCEPEIIEEPEPEHCETTPPCTTTPPPCSTTPPPCDENHENNFVVDTLHKLSDCKTRKDGTYLFHSRHCRYYYVCQSGRAQRQRCTNGQWFDGHTKTCRARRHVTNCPANRS